jgi:hypothetical protein
METFTNILNGEGMNLNLSATDPSTFYKQQGGKVIFILVLYVDDAICEEKRKYNGLIRRLRLK